MRTLVFTIALMAMTTMSIAQGLVTTVKSFPLGNHTYCVINLPGDVKMSPWSSPFVRINTEIYNANIPMATLNNLVTSGFFNIALQELENGVEFYFPNQNKEMTIGNKTLIYQIKYTVYIPEEIEFNLTSPVTAEF